MDAYHSFAEQPNQYKLKIHQLSKLPHTKRAEDSFTFLIAKSSEILYTVLVG